MPRYKSQFSPCVKSHQAVAPPWRLQQQKTFPQKYAAVYPAVVKKAVKWEAGTDAPRDYTCYAVAQDDKCALWYAKAVDKPP